MRLGFEPDAAQVEVLRSEAKRGILNCTRQWGKSTVGAAKAVHRAQTRAGSLVLVASPTERQSAELLRKANAMLRKLGVQARGDGSNTASLLLPNGSRLVGLPGTEGTVRGFSAVSLLLIDEAARVEDALYLALRPMLAVGDGDLWLMSTPNGKRGFFYESWEHGGEDWMRVRVPATECARISKKFLEEQRSAMGDAWFRQEHMCEFIEGTSGVFDRDVVERAIDDEVEPLWE
jgi:terminase large subunit-like protein